MLIFFTWLCVPMFTCLYFADNMTITVGNCLKLIFTFSATNHLKSFFLQICWAAICKTCNIASSIRIIYVIQLLKVVLLKMCVCVCVGENSAKLQILLLKWFYLHYQLRSFVFSVKLLFVKLKHSWAKLYKNQIFIQDNHVKGNPGLMENRLKGFSFNFW